MNEAGKCTVSISAHEINSEYRKAKSSFVGSANHILNVGRMLVEKKAELGHGNFIPWIEDNCEFDRFFSARSIKAWDKYGECALNAHLTEVHAQAVVRIAWGNKGSVVEKYTGEDEWYTPETYVFAARKVLGSIDLDPASCAIANKTVKAKKFYSQEDDGLEQDWHGNVFLNPPYKQPLVSQFVEKLIESHIAGDVNAAILLTNNSTDTKWWQLAARESTAACFTAGRIKFYRDREYDSPTNGQVFLFFGWGWEAFVSEFSQYGWTTVRANG